MFGWLSRKPPSSRVFETNEAALDYAREEQSHTPLLEAVIPGLVLECGTTDEDGVRNFLVRLATGQELWTCTLQEAPAYPQAGDLVGFRVVKIASDLPADACLIGFIAVKLAPEWIEKKGWRVVQNLTPQNLKPTVRW